MKSEMKNSLRGKDLCYPKLMVVPATNLVVFFCKHGEGVVIHMGKGVYGIGYYSMSWDMREFIDLPSGTQVILTQE